MPLWYLSHIYKLQCLHIFLRNTFLLVVSVCNHINKFQFVCVTNSQHWLKHRKDSQYWKKKPSRIVQTMYSCYPEGTVKVKKTHSITSEDASHRNRWSFSSLACVDQAQLSRNRFVVSILWHALCQEQESRLKKHVNLYLLEIPIKFQ